MPHLPRPTLLLMVPVLACAARSAGPETPPAEEPVEVPSAVPATANPSPDVMAAEAILAPLESELPDEMRQTWPPSEWSYARAFTYNFVSYGPGHQLRVVDDQGWSSDLRQDLPLSPELADAALELTHLTLGDVRASKCAFPRHAVVFYGADDQPIASVNICFECTDILLWPSYSSDEASATAKYELHTEVTLEEGDTIELPLLFSVHEEVLDRWSQLFGAIGADSYPPSPVTPPTE